MDGVGLRARGFVPKPLTKQAREREREKKHFFCTALASMHVSERTYDLPPYVIAHFMAVAFGGSMFVSERERELTSKHQRAHTMNVILLF